MTPSQSKSSDESPAPKKAKAGPLRPDEMSPDMFEFISAIDRFKRDEMRSFLELEDVVKVLTELGYGSSVGSDTQAVDQLEGALNAYRQEHGRLFPNWSEIFTVVLDLGYARD